MSSLKLKIKLSILTAIVILVAVVKPVPASAVIPVIPIADPTAVGLASIKSFSDALAYLTNKMGTIFFQNILRKYLNDFAKDAANYLAYGGKGQQAAYVKNKWSNFWTNVGDAAVGDFIESFANSVVADEAYRDRGTQGIANCEATYTTCIKEAGDGPSGPKAQLCIANRTNCLKGFDVAGSKDRCNNQKEACVKACSPSDGTQGPDAATPDCLNSCNTMYKACNSGIGSSLSALDQQRKAPLLGLGTPLGKINMCNPTFDVVVRINLGLVETSTGFPRNCRFTDMKRNWTTAYQQLKDMTSADYLRNFATWFDPTGSDLSYAFFMNVNMLESQKTKSADTEKEILANKGWLNLRNFAGDIIGTPEESVQVKQLAEGAMWDNFGKVTGDIFVDAANIFANQFLIAGWQNLMQNLTQTTDSGVNLRSYYSAPATSREALETAMGKLTEPNFAEPGRMDIIAQLATCPREDTSSNALPPGPTNCVINSNFSNAITSQLTVYDAVQKGLLPGNAPFGFNKYGEDNINYREGYPYRSLIILRKYRIIPVGWEIAAQEIQREYLTAIANPTAATTLPLFKGNDTRPAGVTLNDLLACYSDKDSITGYYSTWCQGLIDPYWVLKVPDYYCKARGYGPELAGEPTSQNNGIRFCSNDKGVSKALIDGAMKECAIDTDCCDKDETAIRAQNLRDNKQQKDCISKCAYQEKKLILNRTNNYCGDEQGCIGHDKNGKCIFWGYCTEEKRKWTFSRTGQDKVCKPTFNTCTAYRDEKNQLRTFLANTLDFSRCDQNNDGCRKYLLGGAYNETTNLIAWDNTASSINLNKKTADCTAADEGCHEYIRTASNLGTNLLADGDLELNDKDHWQAFGFLANSNDKNNPAIYDGEYSLHTSGLNGILYNKANTILLPVGFSFEANQTYTLSAYVYIKAGTVEMGMGGTINPDTYQKVSSDTVGSWENFVLTVDNTADINIDSFYIKGLTANADFYVDNIKFAIGNDGKYTGYRSNNLIYEKILPTYLEKVCYVNPPKDYSLKADAVLLCSKFARKCNKDEVGCELFTDVITKDETAAKVKVTNTCPSECVGYDTFVQKSNSFYSAREDYFIAKTARTCRQEVQGCAAFTNLDKIKEGGETIEYYSNFRNCIKPDVAKCAQYYTWRGSADTGYKVIQHELVMNKTTDQTLKQPYTISDNDETDNIDGAECNETIYGLPADDPRYNPDCMQFYGKDEIVSYHLYSKTVSCSNECSPFRMKDINTDPMLDSKVLCDEAKGVWDNASLTCAVCAGAGVYDVTAKACIYQAIEKESTKCSANDAGCSLYTGNFSNTVKFIINDTFESGLSSWNSNNNPINISSEALNQGGHSVTTAGNFIKKDITGKVAIGKKYELSFMAKNNRTGDGFASISMYDVNNNAGIIGSANNSTFVENLVLTDDWRLYNFTIDNLNRDSIASLQFLYNNQATNGDKIFIDNIRLKEINDKYYLIRNSWTTPESCNKDSRGNPLPRYALGCRQYKDQTGANRYLKSFDSLCQYSAVGCEALIDTQNNNDYRKLIFNDKDAARVEVPADAMIYAVYDKTKTCFKEKKGCSRLGLQSLDDNSAIDTYKVNDAERYATILCKADDVGCASWVMETGGQVYFKNPGNRVCEYRQNDNSGTYGWLKKKNTYCFSKTVCTNNAGCPGGQCRLIDGDTAGIGYCTGLSACTGSCAGDDVCELSSGSIDKTADSCTVDYTKTIGLGVAGEKVQPDGDFLKTNGTRGYAGACSASDATCTEYIDPEARINPIIAGEQNSFTLKRGILYSVRAGTAGASVSCSEDFYRLDASNKLVLVNSLAISANASVGLSDEIMGRSVDSSGNEIKGSLVCSINGADVKEAIVAYRLKSSLNQQTPTNVDFIKGAVLFNERTINTDGTYKTLTWHTNLTDSKGSYSGIEKITPPVKLDPPGNNTNVLLQVQADRDCSTWLGCRSYGVDKNNKDNKDSVCLIRGLCDQLNDAGECVHFIDQTAKPVNQTFDGTSAWINKIANKTGYSKVGYAGNLQGADLYDLGTMEEAGDTKVKFDGTFENKVNSDFNYPPIKANALQYAPIISDAAVIQSELGLSAYRYTPDGQTIAKTSGCVEKVIDGVSGSDYILSSYIYLRYGSKATLRVGDAYGSVCPIDTASPYGIENCETGSNVGYAVVAQTVKTGKWVRISGRFHLNAGYISKNTQNKLKVSLCNDGGSMFFDDIRLEPGLEIANDQTSIARASRVFIHSSCRLYPEQGSLSCDYYADGGLRKKGWAGYCLEFDPRNSGACLLWYPMDKVASEEYEEGAGLDIPDDLYYCLNAEDQCGTQNLVEPVMACQTFLKVDKTKYWYGRIQPGSQYAGLPAKLFRDNGSLLLDFGIDTSNKAGGTATLDVVPQGIASGYYGAYPSRESLSNQPIEMGLSGKPSEKKPYPYLPYGGYNYGGSAAEVDWSKGGSMMYKAKREKGMCMATKAIYEGDNIDYKGKLLQYPHVLDNNKGDVLSGQYPYTEAVVGPYDGCFVRFAADEHGWAGGDCQLNKLESEANGPDELQDRCCVWDPTANSGQGGCGVGVANNCKDNRFLCGSVSCLEEENNRLLGTTYNYCSDGNHASNKSNNNLTYSYYKDYYLYINDDSNSYKNIGYRVLKNTQPIGPDNGGDNVRCQAWRNYSAKGDEKNILLRNTDTLSEASGDSTFCGFDCYNFINKFNMAQGAGGWDDDQKTSMSRASKAVNRLFISASVNDPCYRWDETTFQYKKCSDDFLAKPFSSKTNSYKSEIFTLSKPNSGACTRFKNGEAARDGNEEMCYVFPEITNPKLNLPIDAATDRYTLGNKSAWVDITFNSTVDMEQMPLRNYTIDVYGNGKKIISRTANMFARPDAKDPHIIRYFFDRDEMNNLGVTKPFRPSITITDNWGYFHNNSQRGEKFKEVVW